MQTGVPTIKASVAAVEKPSAEEMAEELQQAEALEELEESDSAAEETGEEQDV